jgi:hypothetical protein
MRWLLATVAAPVERLLAPPPPQPASNVAAATAQQANRTGTQHRIAISTPADHPADSTSLYLQLSCQLNFHF